MAVNVQLDAPSSSLDFPAGQSKQALWPVSSWYAPAAQRSHAPLWPACSWYVPSPQIAHAVWPAADWRHPEGQLWHALALVRPVCALYVPAAQAVFVEKFGQ